VSLAAAATTLAAASAYLAPAEAITNGTPDDGTYSMVGMMVAQDETGEPLWRCSGSLISPTVFITAGHCTSDEQGGSVAHVELFFETTYGFTSDVFLEDVSDFEQVGDPSCESDEGERYDFYPCTGEYTGTAYTHPAYDPALFPLHDLGVVILDQPVELEQYAELPGADELLAWKSGTKQDFTSVGYGLQEAYPGAAGKDLAENIRTVSSPRLVKADSPSLYPDHLLLSNNADTGGTCYGDSGGPNFLAGTFVIAGVTSYSKKNDTCSGVTGSYRLDRPRDLAWIDCVVSAPDEAAARECTF
jgi:hypothetical protein